MKRLLPTIAACFLLATLVSGVSASGSTRSEIERALAGLDAAIASGDRERILAYYDLSDPAFRRETEARLSEMVSLDSLSARHRLSRIDGSGSTVSACVYREVVYSENGREQDDAAWATLRFRRDGGVWKIAAEGERTYAQSRSIDLRVDLFPEEGRMEAASVLRVGFTMPGEDNLVLDLNRGLEIVSLEDASGRALRPSRIGRAVIVPLSGPVAEGDSVTLRIRCAGPLFNESAEVGYSQVGIAPGGCFASWVTGWYPAVRGPGSKAAGRIEYTVPAGFTVASSGRPAGRAVEGDRERQVFEVRSPLDYSFAAARYFHREREADGIAIGAYLLRGGDEKAEFYLESCARIIRFLRDRVYGFYPFDGYAIVEIPSEAVGALGGSSEQGMNLFPVGELPDGSFPLPLLAHEIGHSWWGNLVTAKEGAVISEALAQMTAVLCIEEIDGGDAMRRFLQHGYPGYDQSARVYFRSFAGREEKDIPLATRSVTSVRRAVLHDLADVKGHFVYQMLRETIGTEAFIAGLRSAAETFSAKEISLADLRSEWERAGGRPLERFFEQWFERSGAPEFAMRYLVQPAADGVLVTGEVVQTGEPYTVDVEIVALSGAGPHAERLRISEARTPFEFRVAAAPETVLFDPQYRVFRWTPEFRNFALIEAAIALRGEKDHDGALAKLGEYLAMAPGEPAGLFQVGLCEEERARLKEADRTYREVLERQERLGIYHPVLPLCALHLGRICDMTERREEAIAWYRKALSLPDERGCHREAERHLAVPFVPREPGAGPAREELERYAGDYGHGEHLRMAFKLSAAGVLTGSRPGSPDVTLEWIEGSLFRLSGGDDITVEFLDAGEGRARTARIRVGERVYDLPRGGS